MWQFANNHPGDFVVMVIIVAWAIGSALESYFETHSPYYNEPEECKCCCHDEPEVKE